MIYEYWCPECGGAQEFDHHMNESPKVLCPFCLYKMKRVVTGGSGFILKGGDWPGRENKNGVKETHKSKSN